MLRPVDFVFNDDQLEAQFAKFIADDPGKERGGVLFFVYDQVTKMHWRMHERIFGQRYFGIITDWIVCPNTSNLPDREYSVSDLKQLLGIAEQTAKARHCYAMHFHTHPIGSTIKPSKEDFDIWWKHFNKFGSWTETAIAAPHWDNPNFALACHRQDLDRQKSQRVHRQGLFYSWNEIDAILASDERYQKMRGAA